MNLPDSFPKQFKLLVAVDMVMLMDASITQWGKILEMELKRAEMTAVEQIRDFRNRMRVFRYCGADPGENFEFDNRIVLATDEDGIVYLVRPDLLPIGDFPLRAHLKFLGGKYEEYQEEDGTWTFREVKNNESPSA